MDTTLRDGEQTQGISFSPAEKINIAKALLEQLKVDRIEVASARVSGGEKEAVESINRWAATVGVAEQVEVLGFVDHTKSVDWIVETGGKVINLLTKGSKNHCLNQLKTDLAGHLKEIHKTINYAHKKGLEVNVYLEDWSNGYRDSPDHVFEMMSNLQGCGIRHFMLPDTLGVLTPDEVYASLSDMIARFPDSDFDFHPHNDYGLATANAMMAVKAGIRSIHCTVNCLGERAGNVSLSEVVANLNDHMEVELSVDESHIFRISQMVEYFSGKRIADNTPVVGADVFTQTSGIHADGDKKGRLYESRLSPERFSRRRNYALGKMSGKASLLKNLERLDISLSEENQQKVLQRIIELGDSKKTITTEDLPFIIADVLESKDYDHIRLINCSITSGLELESTASIRVDIQGEISLASGIGNGGFDAFANAIKKILKKRDISLPKLLDFEVRIPKGGRSEALTECIITWDGEPDSFKTRGVHSNQVFAAINATLRMLNIRLHQEQMSGKARQQ
ncbi:(R)-citramalate synthase [hydrothermal vent metagenome]|uniref:(R)-citramalate synthase n=1 Tax=hydrothermal vent metagenome TaxID=652676 RepID=A0A3B1BAH9_9ZZZZ